MILLTAEQLTKVCPSIKGDKAERIAKAHNDICPQYGIINADILHELLANELEESWEFGKFEEKLNYSAKRLMVVWPTRFPTMASALPYSYNPQKLAEKTYGGRMGNVQPGDGWKFRGGGPIQITGRDMYLLFTIFYNKKFGTKYTIEQMAELLRTNIEMGIHSACWLFTNVKKLIPLAIADNMVAIVKKINGGVTNLAKRNEYYRKAVLYIK